ncbi:MAG: Long-chain-fatty-acid--CoA ligase [Pseudomonas fluorescens]|nr:MAG: Long-chain-fatty-acid--CoA ligase [Pseudomonas fluorescens]
MEHPNQSYSRGSQDKQLLAMTLGQAFDRTVAQYPDSEALVVCHQQLRYTWRQLADTVELHARALLALGLQTGDRLGIWAPNCAQWCISQLASAKVGVILVNINPAYRTSELEYVLKQSGCQWLICAGAFKTSDYHAMLQELVPELAEQPVGQLQARTLPDLRGAISLDPRPPAGFLPWAQLASLGAGIPPEQLHHRQAALHFDQAVNIQYTSGTTGFPKGATLSHHNILNNGYMVGESLGLTAQDRLVIR